MFLGKLFTISSCAGGWWLLFSGSRKGARRWQRGKEPVLQSSDSLLFEVIAFCLHDVAKT